MKYWELFIVFIGLASLSASAQEKLSPIKTASTYNVLKLKKPVEINGKWNKPQWRKAKTIEVKNFIRENPSFRPTVQAKMMYDDENLYVIFRVKDQYVRSITTDINGPVWKDATVEFFFSPDTSSSQFFNLEVNSGGIPLLGFRSKKPEIEDIKMIEIAHSLPQPVDPEIIEPIVWTVEYKIPLDMLEKYSKVVRPKKGVEWKANFYKIAENNSNPHHASWSIIFHPKPTFHMPQYFGTLKF